MALLTVRCEEIMAIRNELAVYVSDQVGAVPILKSSEFVLSPIEDDDDPLDKDLAVTAIREYLDSLGESRNFVVVPADDLIFVKSTTGKTIQKESRPNPGLYACPHCGFLTQYETEHNTHMKMHYL